MGYLLSTIALYALTAGTVWFVYGMQTALDYEWFIMLAIALPIAAIKFTRERI